MGLPATAARWWPRPPAKCRMTTWTVHSLCRYSVFPMRIRRSRSMSDVLLDLPSHLRDRLVSALESGLLGPSPTLASLRSVLGDQENAQDVGASLLELARLGISGPIAACWLRIVDRAAARTRKPDLVWSGPEVPLSMPGARCIAFFEVIDSLICHHLVSLAWPSKVAHSLVVGWGAGCVSVPSSVPKLSNEVTSRAIRC
jgi:hypothetical protein